MAKKQLDETLQLVDRLMKNMVVKQIKLASADPNELQYEEEFVLIRDSLDKIDGLADYRGDISFELLELIRPGYWTREQVYDINWGDINMFSASLTAKEEDDLVELLRNRRQENYYEYNEYYRMILGLPPSETDPKDFVYIDGKPIHQLSDIEYYKLKVTGKMDVIIAQHPEKKYLKYINRGIDLVQARQATQFEVLWMPDKPEHAMFREIFNKERKVWMATYHNEHMTYVSDYNEALELTTLKLRAVIMYLIHRNSPILDKSSYTKEESELLFREVGLNFPKEMSANYRDAVSFVLNYLVMFKGTNYVVKFVAEKIFSGLKLYKYMIRKRHKKGLTYPIPAGTPATDVYDVDFILTPFVADNYIDVNDGNRDQTVLTYDEVVQMDPRWRDSDQIKKAVFEEEFSYADSKYLALDNMVDLNDFSIRFSLLARHMIERKKVLEKVSVVYNMTGHTTNFFKLWIYYMALFTTFLEETDVVSPDMWRKIPTLLGFHIPPDFVKYKMMWAAMFRQTPHGHFCDKFPDMLNDDDQFFAFLTKAEKTIGLAIVFEDILRTCETHEEVTMFCNLYRMVRVVATSPSSYDYDLSTGKIEGKTYIEWLEVYDETLYQFFLSKFTSENSVQDIVDEIDNCTQVIVEQIAKHQVDGPYNDINNILFRANSLYGGISKYMMYILKLFKAYSVDFITENSVISLTERFNSQYNVDQITPKVDIRLHDRHNMSQFDTVLIAMPDGSDPKTRPIIEDRCTTFDKVFLTTPYGEIEIS